MRKSKTIYLLIFLVIILIGLLALKNLPLRKQPGPTTETTINSEPYLTITSVNLSDQPFSITEPILITFSRPVEEKTMKILLIPQTPATIQFDSSKTQLIIDPQDAWNFNTNYQLSISKEAKSQAGLSLDKDYIYAFKTIGYSGI